MLWTPRRHRAPPSLQLPYGVPGTSPIGLHQRLSGAATITRAGTRWFRNGSSFAELAENTACTELDADSRRYVSVYGEYTNECLYSSAVTDWNLGGAPTGDTLSDSGIASPIAGKNWLRLVESPDLTYHAAFHTNGALVQNQKLVAQALMKSGDRRYLGVRIGAMTSVATAGILIDTVDGSVTDTGTLNTMTLHGYGVIPISSGVWLPWVCCSDSHATPGTGYIFLSMSDSATFSEADYDVYDGDPTTYPLGMLFCGALLCPNACGPLPIIETGAAAVTKSAEVNALGIADYGIPGGLGCLVRTWCLIPTNKRIWSWYDASTDAAIELFLDSAGHVHLRVHDGTSETVDIEVTTAVNDGVWHRVRCGWEHNNTWLSVDGTLARDTSCTMPALADLDASRLGASESGQQLDGDIAEFEAYRTRLGS